MNEDQYVIFWYHSGLSVAGDQHYETYETADEAQAALRSFAASYPWNTYRLARIIGEQPATQEEPKDPYWLGITVTEIAPLPKAKAEVVVENGTITAVIVR